MKGVVRREEMEETVTVSSMGWGWDCSNKSTSVQMRQFYNKSGGVVCPSGDGTMLLAASKVLDRLKPVIGVNTDPER